MNDASEWFRNIPAFIVVIGILITVHEWGHFAVARAFGVRVLRFSVGFGKPLWSRTGRDGTEYVIAAIPLGGYVAMLDEREAEVAPAEAHRAFNRQSVPVRAAIVAAGPAVNLLFAVIIYWALLLGGVTALAPVVGDLDAGSPAARAGLAAGDEIVAVDGADVATWDDMGLRLAARAGESGELAFTVRGASGVAREVRVPVQDFLATDQQRPPTAQLGLRPLAPQVEMAVGQVGTGSPAARAGLQPGDRLLAVDGAPIRRWDDMSDVVSRSAGRAVRLEIERAGVRQVIEVVPEPSTDNPAVARIGVAAPLPVWPDAWPASAVREVSHGPVDALGVALVKTWDTAWLSLDAVAKMVTGELSVKALGGPVTIARGAGATAAGGLDPFLAFLAFLSISIGVLNLLPIPVLDGGHLVFLGVEAVTRRPLNERVQVVLTQVFAAMLMALMAVVLFNDFMRL